MIICGGKVAFFTASVNVQNNYVLQYRSPRY